MGTQPGESSTRTAHTPAANLDPTAHQEPDHGMPAGPYAEPVGAVEAAGPARPRRRPSQDEPLNLQHATPGGSKELLKLALPLIVSQSFMTVQVFVDTVLLSWHDPLEMTASFPAVMWYWLFFGVLQVTAGYTSTFVAQYTGANRPHRVGPAVWQGIHFAVVAGLAVPGGGAARRRGSSRSAATRRNCSGSKTIYLQCLAFAALPMLVMAAVNGFFSGRGQTWTVLGIEAFGTRGEHRAGAAADLRPAGASRRWGSRARAGRRWPGRGRRRCSRWRSCSARSTAPSSTRARVEARARAVRPADEVRRPGRDAGVPRRARVPPVHAARRRGSATRRSGATTLTVRLNMIAFLPMMGLGQAICILVGQRLGENRPDLAEKSTYTGLKWSFGYMCLVALVYVAIPTLLVAPFEPDDPEEPEKFAAIAAIVPTLLLCVAVFSLADAVNLSFAFALRGAGDTKFVTLLTFCLAWPLMVIPTALTVWLGGNVYWAGCSPPRTSSA